MIKATIHNGSKTISISTELPCNIYKFQLVQFQLDVANIPCKVQDIKLTKNENTKVSVTLTADGDIGDYLISLINESDSLADLNNVALQMELFEENQTDPNAILDILKENAYGSISEIKNDMNVIGYKFKYRNMTTEEMKEEFDHLNEDMYTLTDKQLEELDYEIRYKAIRSELEKRVRAAGLNNNVQPQVAESKNGSAESEISDNSSDRVVVIGGEISPHEKLRYMAMMQEKHPDWEIKKMTISIVDDDYVDIECEYTSKPFSRIRRITGYLVGDQNRFNNAKTAEVRDRVKHEIPSGNFEDVYIEEDEAAI